MTEQTPDEVLADALPNSRRASIVGLLGVGSLPGLLFCGLGGVLAGISLVLAPAARREIEASRGELGGLGIIRAARICSIVSLGLELLGSVALVLLVVFVLKDSGPVAT